MPPVAQSGTGLANIDTILSCRSSSPVTGWGGARNRADRTSTSLTLAQCESLIAAAEHAQSIGLPFNRHWTLHYERARVAELEAVRFIGRMLKFAGDYARRRNGKIAVVWVRENGTGGHVHILLHLPAGISLVGKTARWVRLAGGKSKAGVSFIRSVGRTVGSAAQGGEGYRHNADKVRTYILKGADCAAGAALGLKRFGRSGFIIGKRCGSTQNIAKAARGRLT